MWCDNTQNCMTERPCICHHLPDFESGCTMYGHRRSVYRKYRWIKATYIKLLSIETNWLGKYGSYSKALSAY